MKRLLMMIVLLAACLASVFMGASFFRVSASSARPLSPSPNYFPLENPRMVTADATHVFVVDNNNLLVFNATGGLSMPPPSRAINAGTLFIKHAGNMVFLFEGNGFHAIQYNAGTRDFTNRTPIANVPYRLSGPHTTFKFFDISLIGLNTYRIFFASEEVYGWTDFQFSENTAWTRIDSTSQPPRTLAHANEIKAIASAWTSLYICARNPWDSESEYTVFETSAAQDEPLRVNSHPLPRLTSFSVVANRGIFAYINQHGSLTLSDRNSGPLYIKPLDSAPPGSFLTGASREPYFITTTQNFAYVIDKEKRSVDRYFITNDPILVFDRAIVAHRGGDNDFFNNPTSLTLIDSAVRGNANDVTEYIVTDRAGQVSFNRFDNSGRVTSQPFFASGATRLSNDVRATFDFFDTVYIYDYDTANQRNRVRGFSLDGTPRGPEFIGMGRISHIFADTSRAIYVLDIDRQGIFQIGATNPIVPLPLGYAITPQTTANYCDTRNAIILANGTNTIHILPLDGAAQTSQAFAQNIIDVATDSFGNLFTMSVAGGEAYINGERIAGSTVDTVNPSLNLDRINRRIVYLGTNHAPETYYLGDRLMNLLVDFEHDTTWRNLTAQKATDTLFLQSEDRGTVIYQYPGGTRALGLAPRDSVFKLLDAQTYYVLYENPSTGEHITGYVSQKSATKTEPYTEPIFDNARVMFSHTIVYKFPTTSERLTLLTLEKNFEQYTWQNGGLRLENKVIAPDVRGFSFYEILLSRDEQSGQYFPDVTGIYVGYVNANNVIDYYLGPSIPRFLPNATVNIPASANTSSIQVYELANSGVFVPLQNEILTHRQNIRFFGRLDRSQKYTYIHYDDAELGRTRDGWIETKYIMPNGLSALQLIAIAVLVLIVIAGVVFVVILIRRKMLSS